MIKFILLIFDEIYKLNNNLIRLYLVIGKVLGKMQERENRKEK